MKLLVLVLAVLTATQVSRGYYLPDESRIVGGHEVTPHELPFQAALNINNPTSSSLCGGSLISKKYILTAAHCVNKAESVEVILGAHNIEKEEATQIKIIVPQSNIFVHEGYDAKNNLNDIALLEFTQEIEFNENIRVIPLPDESFIGISFVDEYATVSGWGRYSDSSSSPSDVLRSADMPIITNEFCNSVYGNIKDGHICADGFEHHGACNGDSGGPLTIENVTRMQVGVVSFGSSFGCSFGFPSVYTRITHYLNWIKINSDI